MLELETRFFLISVPPSSVTLKEPKIVKAGEFLEMACTATDSNPKTNIFWYRGYSSNPIPILEAGKTLTDFTDKIPTK